MAEKKGICPRCGSNDIASFGSTTIKVGTTRGLTAEVYACGKCTLVFFELKEKT